MHDVEVFIDFCCPWCLIGMVKLQRSVAALQGVAEPQLKFRPFLLDPAAPPAGVNIHERLKSRYGAEPAAMFAPIEAEARQLGLALELSTQPWSYPTQSAHALMRAAAVKEVQLPLALAILDAYFLKQSNIGDVRVLARIANQHGLTEAEAANICGDKEGLARVEEEARNALVRGVRSVPTLIVSTGQALSANAPPAVLTQALRAG